jgi:FMN phosphatase YigB (HAD superfamily)
MYMQIFTNSDKAHAARVLEKLGLQDCFQGIVCFETLNPRPPTETEKNSSGSAGTILCKPSLASMEAVIEIAKLDAERTVRTVAHWH